MRFPKEFPKSIGEQKIYLFSSTKISTSVPHYFICIKRTDDEVLILACCTSQFEKSQRIISRNKWPQETLVWIKPDSINKFKKETYINCNETYDYTVDEFAGMYEDEILNYIGEISDNHYRQILHGIHMSKKVEQDTKDMLPNPDNI